LTSPRDKWGVASIAFHFSREDVCCWYCVGGEEDVWDMASLDFFIRANRPPPLYESSEEDET
jgi:hypothetical protein